ncbi:hypothetical protein LTR53_019483, partial [Teratosphaeriaceae sp. CCFEE 6253]
VFEQLRQPVDPKVQEQRDRDLNERMNNVYEKSQQRQAELVRLSEEAILWCIALMLFSSGSTLTNR